MPLVQQDLGGSLDKSSATKLLDDEKVKQTRIKFDQASRLGASSNAFVIVSISVNRSTRAPPRWLLGTPVALARVCEWLPCTLLAKNRSYA